MSDAPAQVFANSPASASEVRPRLWPGIAIIVLQWAAMKVPGWLEMNPMIAFQALFFAPIVAALALAVWWLFFSRVPREDRVLGVGACAVLGGLTYVLVDASFGGFGMLLYALPAALSAWVVWLAVGVLLPWQIRKVGLVVVLFLTWGYFTTLRFDGINGAFQPEMSFRWTPTAEKKLLAELASRKPAAEAARAADTSAPLALQPGDWPCFRGPNRDGRLVGVRINVAWSANPPRLLWKQRIGPGWSSFAVIGSRLFTQEQRGEQELVVCYDAETGGELWAHADSVRFTEVVAGPGPRATPTFHEGRLYTLGAKGALNCLDARSGKLLWARDIVVDAGRDKLPVEGERPRVPQWGFASSPLVAHGLVSVFAGGPEGKSVLGYHAATGEPAWAAGEGELSYSSPQLSRLDGVEQILSATDAGLTAFQPLDGKVLWHHAWTPMKDLARIVQPAVLSDSEVLLGTGMIGGTRCLRVSQAADGWSAVEQWTSAVLRPYFNDFVVYDGHLYGFDNSFFTCVSAKDGKKKWRERGYGNGQVLLLANQGLLLVVTETGDVALVEPNPSQHKELARFQAIEGKTWNHPVIAHSKLFVRNGEEMACFDVSEPTTRK